MSKLITVHIGEGVPSLNDLRTELDDMTAVLLGRVDSPLDVGVLSLMEVAQAYYARALELVGMIQRAESTGAIVKGSQPYKFRTGELRTFVEMAKSAIELGSRRVTVARMEDEST